MGASINILSTVRESAIMRLRNQLDAARHERDSAYDLATKAMINERKAQQRAASMQRTLHRLGIILAVVVALSLSELFR